MSIDRETNEVLFTEPPADHIFDWWCEDNPSAEAERIGGNDLDKLLTQMRAITKPVKRVQAFVSSKDGSYVLVSVTRGDGDAPRFFEVLAKRCRAIPEHTLDELKVMFDDDPTFWRD